MFVTLAHWASHFNQYSLLALKSLQQLCWICMQIWWRLFIWLAQAIFIFQKAPIDPFTRESCKPSASQGVPLGGMGYCWSIELLQWYFTFYYIAYQFLDWFCRSGSISRGFRGEFKHWKIIPGLCEASPIMANQFSVHFSILTSNFQYSFLRF